MGKKTELKDHKEIAKVETVLELLRKQTPLTVKQVFILIPPLLYLV